jgi:O-antigen/teichoic acid export membrane protein
MTTEPPLNDSAFSKTRQGPLGLGVCRVLSWFKEDVFRRLFINTSKLLSANMIAALMGLASAVVTARALGPADYGILALVLTYEMTVGKLVSFNAWQAIIKFGSEAMQAGDRPALRQLLKFGFGLDISSAAAGTILAIAMSGPMVAVLGWDLSIRPLLLMYSFLILFNLSGTAIGTLRLFDRFELLGYSVVCSALLRLAGVLWCVLSGKRLFGFVLAYLITGIVGQIYLLLSALWVLRRQDISLILRQPLRGICTRFIGLWDYVWTTNLNATVRMLSLEADGLIVAGLTTPTALGVFKVAKQFARVLPMLAEPLYQSIYPELSRLWAAGSKNAFVSLIKRTTVLAGIAAVAAWIGFLVSGKWMIAVTVGPQYVEAYRVTVIYLAAMVIAISGFSLQPSMLAIGLPRNAFKALAAATTLYLLLLFPLVHAMGIQGAPVAYMAYYLVWAAMMLRYLRPHLTQKDAHV